MKIETLIFFLFDFRNAAVLTLAPRSLDDGEGLWVSFTLLHCKNKNGTT